jgi:hypothetical protein
LRTDLEKITNRTSTLENWRYAIGAALLMGAGGTVATVAQSIPGK